MDNASKAIIIAGGVLIALAIISIALSAYNSARDYARTSEEILTVAQIEAFNRFYTAFDSTNIRGIDAVNLLNRAIEDDIGQEESSAMIEKDASGNYYVISDPENYTNGGFVLTLSKDPTGKVSKVAISMSST